MAPGLLCTWLMGRTLWVVLVAALAILTPVRASAQRLGGVSSAVHGGGGGGGFRSGGGGFRTSGSGYGYRGYGYGAYGTRGGAQFSSSPRISLYYPYYLGYTGVGVQQDSIAADRTFEGPSVLGVIDASAGYVFDGVVRGQISGRVRVAGVLDVEGRYGAYFEQTADAIHELGIGRLAIVFPFVREDVIELRGGIAGQIYHDAHGAELGYAGVLEADIYPTSPLVLHLEGSVGALGRAGFVDARASVGIQIERGELYVGYQVFAVDPFAAAGTALHGPIAGIRVWIS